MRRTAIQIPMLGQDRVVERLRHIVSLDPRLRIAVYHRRGSRGRDPLYRGWGQCGMEHFYVLEASKSVPVEDLREIADALAEEGGWY